VHFEAETVHSLLAHYTLVCISTGLGKLKASPSPVNRCRGKKKLREEKREGRKARKEEKLGKW